MSVLEWKKKVYRMAKSEKVKMHSKSWLSMRRRVFKRDKYMCQRCEKFFGEDGLMLQAHHVIPRPRGRTILNNLITLCNPCHDFVELNGMDSIRTIGVIKPISTKPRWQQWVYGGYAKPNTTERN